MSKKYVYLDEVVNEYLSQYRLPDSDYGRIASLGIRGRKELHLYATGNLRTEKLTMLANKTVKVPCEILNLTRVFYKDGSGIDRRMEPNADLFEADTYSYNRETGVISFHTGFSINEVYIEFLPQASMDGDYIVDEIFVQPLIDWIIWQDGRGDRKTSSGTTSDNRSEYFNSLRNAKKAQRPFDVDQVYINYKRILNNALRAYRWR